MVGSAPALSGKHRKWSDQPEAHDNTSALMHTRLELAGDRRLVPEQRAGVQPWLRPEERRSLGAATASRILFSLVSSSDFGGDPDSVAPGEQDPNRGKISQTRHACNVLPERSNRLSGCGNCNPFAKEERAEGSTAASHIQIPFSLQRSPAFSLTISRYTAYK